jgi:hypothetical protein
MTSIAVFVIAFGVGCLTGVVVRLLTQDPRASDSTRASPFWALTSDD